MLVTLSGPSGAGKTMLASLLFEAFGGRVLPSWTTRRRRSKEKSIYEHVSCEEYRCHLDEKSFLLSECVAGYQYGTMRQDVVMALSTRQICVCDLTAKSVLEMIEKGFTPNLCIVLMISRIESERRMYARGDDERDITGRVERYDEEVKNCKKLSTAFFNVLSLDGTTPPVAIMPMVMDRLWQVLNSPEEIPSEVMEKVRGITKGRFVVDFGSGISGRQHIDFEADSITRWDRVGIIRCDHLPKAKTIIQVVESMPNQTFVLVFFRVLSILLENEIKDVMTLLRTLGNRISEVIVYDYTWNDRRTSEYKYKQTQLGQVGQVHTEWWPMPFSHYSHDQYQKIVPLPLADLSEHSIPAVKHSDDVGSLLVFRR